MTSANQRSLPEPEFGPAMRALSPRWQKAVTALFLTGGNQTEALRIAGYKDTKNKWGKTAALTVLASRMFADDRVRAAIREEAVKHIDVAEPELLATTLSIVRDTKKRDIDRLRGISMIWDRANPVLNRTKVEVEHHLSVDETDVTHYRALQKLGAPQSTFLARFGYNGLARVEAMVAADDAKHKQIETDYHEVENGEE
jgi:hypothetical protein